MRIWWVAVLLGLSACSNMPTGYAPQDPVETVPQLWQGLAKDVAGKTDLLSLVSNTAIEPWLDKALGENPGLRRTMLELAEAGWITRQAGADRLPNVSLVATPHVSARQIRKRRQTPVTAWRYPPAGSWMSGAAWRIVKTPVNWMNLHWRLIFCTHSAR